MRVWRKVYASTLEVPELAQVSDGAIVLFTFLIIAQDDSGYYPWHATSIRRLTATRPDWTLETTQGFVCELVQTGLAAESEGGILLTSGARLNGKPRKGVDEELYQRQQAVTRLSTAVQQDVALEQSRAEQSRAEQILVPLSSKDTDTVQKQSWVCPDWWEPLITLKGYVKRDHTSAVNIVTEACNEANVDRAVVIRGFADYYPIGRLTNGWIDPVAALRKTLAVQISKARNNTGGQSGTRKQPVGSHTAEDYWRKAGEAGQLDAADQRAWDAEHPGRTAVEARPRPIA